MNDSIDTTLNVFMEDGCDFVTEIVAKSDDEDSDSPQEYAISVLNLTDFQSAFFKLVQNHPEVSRNFISELLDLFDKHAVCEVSSDYRALLLNGRPNEVKKENVVAGEPESLVDLVTELRNLKEETKKMSQKMTRLEAPSKIVLSKTNRIHPQPVDPSSYQTFMNQFPFTNVEEVTDFDLKLKFDPDTKHLYISFVTGLLEFNVGRSIRKILRTMFVDTLASRYNSHGSMKKMRLDTMELYQLLLNTTTIYCVENKIKLEPFETVAVLISRWFTNAKTRLNQRSRKMTGDDD